METSSWSYLVHAIIIALFGYFLIIYYFEGILILCKTYKERDFFDVEELSKRDAEQLLDKEKNKIPYQETLNKYFVVFSQKKF